MSLQSYYAQRAGSYERIYQKPERQAELRALEAWLPGCFAGRHVLEIACGTGWWTPHGARDAAAWLATDLNPETLAIARAKALPACVQVSQLDAWRLDTLGTQRFDAAFAGFWWCRSRTATTWPTGPITTSRAKRSPATPSATPTPSANTPR